MERGKRLTEEEMKNIPITTNRINVEWDENKFFEKYAIVSYTSKKQDNSLAYSFLSNTPSLSGVGLKGLWENNNVPTTRFFILTEKGKEADVVDKLDLNDHIAKHIDTLKSYSNEVKQRIIGSLAINSIGKVKDGKMMYNNGSLLVCDDQNFHMTRTSEVVCLDISINQYMVLSASTKSFSHPKKVDDLMKYRNCLFMSASKIDDGVIWKSGKYVKPVVLEEGKKYVLKNYFIPKKSNNRKNTVPYWPYNPNQYSQGKLFVLHQVVKSVNESFKGVIKITFTDYDIDYHRDYETQKDSLELIKEYHSGKEIRFIDPFETEHSKWLIDMLKTEMKKLCNELNFVEEVCPGCMIISLCEPIKQTNDDKSTLSLYNKSSDRLEKKDYALQHYVLDHNMSMDNSDEEGKKYGVRCRRILLDLLVKDCLIQGQLPDSLSKTIQGWEFLRYKFNEKITYGASMRANEEGAIDIESYGFSELTNVFSDNWFIREKLGYDKVKSINGARDYMAMKKDGNLYLIIDTNEIPIFDAELIDDKYEKVVNENEKLSIFKRVREAPYCLRGYAGLYVWKSDGIDDRYKTAYSYICGRNLRNIEIKSGMKLDKMPRARRIFILKQEHPELERQHIEEIIEMLKFGFGRWNDMTTYPFPFKFLQEYLDDQSLIAFSKHWDEISYSKPLI